MLLCMWSSVASLAARQHGVVASRQLREDLHLTRGQVDGLVRRGRLDRVHHGVYVVAGVPASPLVEVMGAVLRSGPGARASGERLLAACGVRDAEPDGPFVVLVPPGRRLPAARHRWRVDSAPACGITASVQGIPSWSIPRNLMEAAHDADDERVRVLADGVRRRSRRDMRSVAAMVVRHRQHVGGRRLLLLGCLDTDAAESPPERLLEVILQDFRPQRQVRLRHDIRVDILLPALRVVVEYDGSDHESGAARVRDAARDAALHDLGYVVVRVTRHDLRAPERIIQRVQAASPRR